MEHPASPCNTLQHSATHCNTLLCSTLQHTATCKYGDGRHTATLCNTLQNSATLQHTATQCNTLQYYCNTQLPAITTPMVDTPQHSATHATPATSCNTQLPANTAPIVDTAQPKSGTPVKNESWHALNEFHIFASMSLNQYICVSVYLYMRGRAIYTKKNFDFLSFRQIEWVACISMHALYKCIYVCKYK